MKPASSAKLSFGATHGFDSGFPISGGVKSTTDALYANWGRLNVGLTRHFGVRALELYYLCTNLPNNTDAQNDLRLGFGISYHIGK